MSKQPAELPTRSETEVRRVNLRLLREILPADQEGFGRTFDLAQSEVSRLETGKDPINLILAMRIERGFGLPAGWMSRNNPDLFLTSQEFDLVRSIRRVNPVVGKAILDLIASLGTEP
jgi:DNA-binding XRE family transcriptional regulator